MDARTLKVVTVGLAVATSTLLSACAGRQATPSQPDTTPTNQIRQSTSASDAPKDPQSQTVQLLSYNDQDGTVEYKLRRWVKGAEAQGHFDEVPGDTGTHRLPLAETVAVRSALSICPTDQPVLDKDGIGAEMCSRQRLVTVLREGTDLTAKIDVDSTGQVTRVAEIYTP